MTDVRTERSWVDTKWLFPDGKTITFSLLTPVIDVDEIDALSLATDAGSAKAVNIVLMGRLAKYFDIAKEKWIAAIEKLVKPQFVEINKKAFELGYSM